MNADYLPRKPIKGQPTPAEQVEVKVMFIEEDELINSKMVALETNKDSIPNRVLDFTKSGWPERPESEL